MFGASRFVRGHSGGMPSLSLAAERFIRADTAIPPTFPKRSATPFQAIEIDSDEERESSLLDFDFNNFTSKPAAMTTAAMKPAAMTAIDRDTKVAKTNDHTRLNLKRKLNEYLQFSDTVDIFVGPQLTKWTLNEELLCDCIPYFKAAFKNGFKESKDKKLELPEDNPEVFGHLVDWLYTEQPVCTICEDFEISSSKEEHENSNHVLRWAQLWVLADKLGCEKLMSWAESTFKDCMHSFKFGVSPEVISFVFEETRETCYLRRWFPHTLTFSFNRVRTLIRLGRLLLPARPST